MTSVDAKSDCLYNPEVCEECPYLSLSFKPTVTKTSPAKAITLSKVLLLPRMLNHNSVQVLRNVGKNEDTRPWLEHKLQNSEKTFLISSLPRREPFCKSSALVRILVKSFVIKSTWQVMIHLNCSCDSLL